MPGRDSEAPRDEWEESSYRPRPKDARLEAGSSDEIRADQYVDSDGKITYVETVYGPKGTLNPALNGDLHPEATYVVHPTIDGEIVGDQTHVFTTDKHGRTVEAHARLHRGEAFRHDSQTQVGKDASKEVKDETEPYEGGHLLAKMFGGGPEKINMVGMLRSVNRGAGDSFGNLERKLARGIRNGADVEVTIQAVYEDESSTVPSQIIVTYAIDGVQSEPKPFTNIRDRQLEGGDGAESEEHDMSEREAGVVPEAEDARPSSPEVAPQLGADQAERDAGRAEQARQAPDRPEHAEQDADEAERGPDATPDAEQGKAATPDAEQGEAATPEAEQGEAATPEAEEGEAAQDTDQPKQDSSEGQTQGEGESRSR